MAKRETEFWVNNIRDPAVFIVTGVRTLTSYLDGDAATDQHTAGHTNTTSIPGLRAIDAGPSVPPTSAGGREEGSYPTGPPYKRQRRGGGRGGRGKPVAYYSTDHEQHWDNPSDQYSTGQDLSEHDGKYWIKNKRGQRLCRGWQTGQCTDTGPDNICWHNSAESHQCRICLKTAHGECDCWNKKKGGKGAGGKPTNKGGKGGKGEKTYKGGKGGKGAKPQ